MTNASQSTQQAPQLSLYGYSFCPYCSYVDREARRMGYDIQWRDTLADPENKRAVRSATGRGSVPVLLIEEDGKDPVWMPESKDIVRYLKKLKR